MIWIAPSEKDLANGTLEMRLWETADQFRANSGLKAQEYSSPILGMIFPRFTDASLERIAKLQTQIQNLRRTRDRLLPRLLSGQVEVKAAPAPQPTGHAASAVVSVCEFMEQYSPGRVPDKIACFGLYLREHRNQREFTKEDLVGLFQEAADPLPKNMTRNIRWAQQIAWVAPSARSPDMYYLTKKGEDAVRAKFAKELVQKTRFSAPARRRNGVSDGKSETATESSPDAT